MTDLDLRAGVVKIAVTNSEVGGRIHFKDTKNHRVREVPLPPFLCMLLDEHIARHPSADGWVFTSPEGGVLRRDVYARYYVPAVERAGLPEGFTFKDLRVSASSLVQSPEYGGQAGKVAQTILGHSSGVLTSEVYTKPYAADYGRVREVLQRIADESPGAAELVAHLSRGDEGKVAALAARPAREAV